jgi:hypothetical protein
MIADKLLLSAERSCLILIWLAIPGLASSMQAQGRVKFHQKISDTAGAFTGTLGNSDYFGAGLVALGDLDGDGVEDVAAGSTGDDDGGHSRGAFWILFLNPDGTVRSHQKVSSTQGGFTGALDNADFFGYPLAAMGDLDGDGIADLAVGAAGDDDGGFQRGAIWILFLNGDGTVKNHQKISDLDGGFTGILDDGDKFGAGLAAIGDLDGDMIGDLAAGAYRDDDGGISEFADRGAVWILFLNSDGTVKGHQKISDTAGGFTGGLDDTDQFGNDVAALGDLDGDLVTDLAVGAITDDNLTVNRGAVWILFLNPNGTVRAFQKIGVNDGGFTGELDIGDVFGISLAAPGDLDGDGVGDLCVGAVGDDDGGPTGTCDQRGAIWILFLRTDGTVKSHRKISDTRGGFGGMLDDFDEFGISLAAVPDLDGDGVNELAAGASGDDDGGTDRGAVWLLFLGEGRERRFDRPLAPGGTVMVPLQTGGGAAGWFDTLPAWALPVVVLSLDHGAADRLDPDPRPWLARGASDPWAVRPGSVVGVMGAGPWLGASTMAGRTLRLPEHLMGRTLRAQVFFLTPAGATSSGDSRDFRIDLDQPAGERGDL